MDPRRTTRRAALGGLAALALAVLARVAPAAAALTRTEARNEANDFIAWCVAEGGTPEVHTADNGRISATCYGLPSGPFFCAWDAEDGWSRSCNLGNRHPHPVRDLPTFEIDPDHPIAGPGGLGPDQAPVAGPATDKPGKRRKRRRR